MRRGRWVAVLALQLAAALAALTACSSSGKPAAAPPPAATSTAATPSPSPSPSPSPTVPLDVWMKRASDRLGTQPQTSAKPETQPTLLRERMQLLFQAVRTGRTGPAIGAFFPLTAYRQVKGISDPDHDWSTRLVALYDADLGALHASVGAGARYEGVDIPTAAAQWVLPGAEYNKGSYWRVYGTRVRYTQGGQQKSFGICSLISWRGQWFVVHLGPINRSGTGGALC